MIETKLAYLAGLFDGEGTITLSKRRSSDTFRTPVISMTSTSRELVEACHIMFGGYIVNKKTYANHHKRAWSWQCSGDAAITTCIALQPYCLELEKRRRIDLIITQYKLVTVRNGKYNPRQLAAKQQFETYFFEPTLLTE